MSDNFELSVKVLAGGAFIYILKIVVEKVINYYFKKAEELEEVKDEVVSRQIAELQTVVSQIKQDISSHKSEMTTHKIIIQQHEKSLNRMSGYMDEDIKTRVRFLDRVDEIMKTNTQKILVLEDTVQKLGKVILLKGNGKK